MTIGVWRRRSRSAGGLVAAALVACTLLATRADASGDVPIVYTFDYTGAPQYWTVPGDATAATFDLLGGAGGISEAYNPQAGGLGGEATGTLTLSPGATYEIDVGGAGGFGSAGWNGGGTSSLGGGGGGTDLRTGAYGLSDRLLVAGGGGGGGAVSNAGFQASGGSGGGLTGGTGGAGDPGDQGGGGGTQSAGGVGPENGCEGENGLAGSFGQGGNGTIEYGSGGGGGGWYGGGSGSAGCANGAGGGGSGYAAPSISSATLTSGVNSGNGRATISYTGEILPSLTVTSDQAPGLVGPVTYTATVAGLPTSPVVTSVGTVTFYDDDTAIPSCTDVPVSSWAATCTTTYSDPGIRDITAASSGDVGQSVLPSASPAFAEQVYTGKLTFSYTGASQSWTVPSSDTSAFFQVYGGAGGNYYPVWGSAPGGEAEGLLPLTAGSTLQINVGGAASGYSGGWNGGGSAGQCEDCTSGGGGGGGSDVRDGAYGLDDRLIVAGGAGGAGDVSKGGGGGGTTGGSAAGEYTDTGGGGGTQSAGGAAGETQHCYPVDNGTDGAFGSGGTGFLDPGLNISGGGGGGWYGGGGGGECGYDGSGGGGGSGYVEPSATYAALTAAVNGGDGRIVVWYDKVAQTIAFAAPSGITTASADFDPGATASSGLAVSYSPTTPSVCTIVSGKLHAAAAGACTIDADQTGDDVYLAAPEVEQTFTIGKGDQTIAFASPTGITTASADFDPGATASSGLTVAYSTATPSVCTIVSGKLHAVAAGACTIDADQAGDASWNPAGQVEQTFTIGKGDQTIAFTAPSGITYGNGDFNPGATASSGLAVAYSSTTPSVCTIVSGKLHAVAAGACTIDADQAGDASWNPADEVEQTFTIGKADQTIAFTSPTGITTASADFDPGATASSGLTVAYSTATPAVCTIVSGKLHAAAAGSCTVEADQAGDDDFLAAPEVEQTFTIGKGDQTIAFASPTGITTANADFDPGATASSGLAVAYSSTTPSVCTIVSGKLHAVAAGACTIDADQAGDASWNPAGQVEQTFTIGKGDQTIAFTAPSGITYGNGDFNPGATASSGLAVAYSTATPSVCTIVSGRLHIVTGGSCTVDANQAGDDNFLAAPEVERTFTIARANQLIVFRHIATYFYYGTDFDPRAESWGTSLPVTLSTDTPWACTIVDGLVHPVSLGQCGITAHQAGNADYNPAEKSIDYWVYQGSQSITFAAPEVTYGHPDVDPGATASSGLAVAYSTTTPSVCTIVSGELHAVAPGTCTVDANQAGGDYWQAAPEVEQTFTIGKGNQTIAFPPPAALTYGDPDLELAATASSGLAVTYTTATPAVCTIVSGELHAVAAGSCTVDADQAGDDDWNSASQLEQTFAIARRQLHVDATPDQKIYGSPDPDVSHDYTLRDTDFAGTDSATVTTGTAACTLAPHAAAAGTYSDAISCAPGTLSAANYALVAGASAALTITPVPAPANTTLPRISGVAETGQVLTVAHGSWSNDPTSFSERWEDCDPGGAACVPIAAATGRTYTVSGGDLGHTIRVEETAANVSGSGAPASSASTPLVASAPPAGATTSTTAHSDSRTGTAQAANDDGAEVTASGEGSFTLASYSSRPTAEPAFAAGGGYFDVHVAPQSSFSTLTIEDCQLHGATSLEWWDGHEWAAVSPQTYSRSPRRCVTATLGSSSSPTIAQLTGTVFSAAHLGKASTGYVNPHAYRPSILVRCAGANTTSCALKVTLTVQRRRHSVAIASMPFHLKAGRHRTARPYLYRIGRRLRARGQAVEATLTVTQLGVVVSRRTITLRHRRSKHRH